MDSQKYIEELYLDLKLVTSNKLSVSQSNKFFSGLMSSIILDKVIFKNNNDLKPFLETVVIPLSKEKTLYKDYLYLSRTLLASRVAKTILTEFEYSEIKISVSELQYYLENSEILIINEYNDNNMPKMKASKNNYGINKWIKTIENTNKERD